MFCALFFSISVSLSVSLFLSLYLCASSAPSPLTRTDMRCVTDLTHIAGVGARGPLTVRAVDWKYAQFSQRTLGHANGGHHDDASSSSSSSSSSSTHYGGRKDRNGDGVIDRADGEEFDIDDVLRAIKLQRSERSVRFVWWLWAAAVIRDAGKS